MNRRTNPMSLTRTMLLLAGAAGATLGATETENHGLRVLPAPAPLAIDGKIADWDLTGGIFACGELEHLRAKSSVWLHAMYDRENLYLLARWKDETPINNPASMGGYGFNGDCLQFRCILFPGTAEKTVTWWTAWRDNLGTSVVDRGWPGPASHVTDNPLPNLANAIDQGVKQSFAVDADGMGYVQELAVPWKLLSVAGRAPAMGERFRLTFEPNFTAGAFGRITIKDLFDDQVAKVDRVFTFTAYDHWGWATLAPAGKVEPQPVRCADGRTFPAALRDGVPTVDWNGLEQRFAWPGFKPITFEMPFAGDVSLNLIGPDGVVARHLINGEARDAGTQTVQWDGLTDATYRIRGNPVPAGTYTWKAIAHPRASLTLRGWASGGGRAPWMGSPEDAWLGDHGVPTAAVTDGERLYLACNGAEGGRHLIATDQEGKLLWSLQNTTGGADPEVIAVDQGTVYIVHPKVDWMKGDNLPLITRADARTGAYQPWQGRKTHIITATDVFGPGGPGGISGPDRILGLDARGGRLYATTGEHFIVLDAATGAKLSAWPLKSGGAVRVIDAATAWVISGNDVLAVDLASGAQRTVATGLTAPRSLATDGKGRVFISLGEPANQVLIVGLDGREQGRVGRAGGRRAIGAWQADGLREPAGMTLDVQGRLWVMERDQHPKRISVWSLGASGATLVKDFFGPAHYGASGAAINPRDPDLMVAEGCEWRIDRKSGQAACLGAYDRNLVAFSTFREANGRVYLMTADGTYGTSTVTIWERRGDADYVKRGSFTPREAERPTASIVWSDANGDGQQQADELQVHEGYLHLSGSNNWSLNAGPDLALYGYDTKANRLVQLPVTGFADSGAPRYDLAKARVLPEAMSAGYELNYSCAVPSADNRSLLLSLAVAGHPAERLWTCFDLASGALRWTYPNPYFQVHGSHKAPAPEAGLFRGAYGVIGSATQPGVGSYWAINGNLGEWWALSADGFFLTRLFNGNVFEWKWPTAAVPGIDMMDLPSGGGGEDFGGSMTQATDGKVYVQSGKLGAWNLALGGLERTVPVGGGSLAMSDADVRQAAEWREKPLAAAGGSELVARAATIAFTGVLDQDFTAAKTVSYQKSAEASVRTALAHDDAKLYVGWEVKDATPWVNGATDFAQMYASGDTVDLQLGIDSKADPKREAAAAGDLRVSIGNLQGKPTAVLYRFISERKKPRVFTSGVVQGWQVDQVEVLADAQVKVTVDAGRGYVVEAAIPLDQLGVQPKPGLALRGDVGATHGDTAGTRTRLRTYWANQQTGLVDDVVFELKPTPSAWRPITIE